MLRAVMEIFQNVGFTRLTSKLHEYALEMDAQQVARLQLVREISPFASRHLPPEGPGSRESSQRWGDASAFAYRMGNLGRRLMNQPESPHIRTLFHKRMHENMPFPTSGLTPDHLLLPIFFFHDELWTMCDEKMWKEAHNRDWPQTPGRIAREFGLVDPRDPNRPMYKSKAGLLRELKEVQAVSIPAPPVTPELYVDNFKQVHPSETTAQSGHAFLKANDQRPPRKTKTRGGSAAPHTPALEEESLLDSITSVAEALSLEEDVEQVLPDVLPKMFYLPRKVTKVCARSTQRSDVGSLPTGLSHHPRDTQRYRGQARSETWTAALV
jgi:hypothetical protein